MVLPSEFQTQNAALQRKKLLADMLMAQALKPAQGQMVSGHYVGPGVLGNIAPIAQAFMGQKMEKDYTKGTQELQGKYQESLSKALQEYQAKAQQDPMAAAQGAMTSEYEPLKQVAKADYERLQKAMTPKVVGGELVSLDPNGQAKSLYNTNPQYSDIQQVMTDKEGRPVMGQIDKRTNQVKVPGGQGSGIQINTRDTADVAFNKALGDRQVKIISDSYDKTLAAGKTIENLDAASKFLDSGVKTGATSDIEMGLARWGEALGLTPPDPEVGITEGYKANMAKETVNFLKNLGTGAAISNADLTFSEKAMGNDAGLTEEGLRFIVDLGRAGAANVALEHQRIMGTTKGDDGTIPSKLRIFDVPFEAPEAPVGEKAAKEVGSSLYIDEKTGKYRVVRPEIKKQNTEQLKIDHYQGVKPVGTNANGLPQYRYEDLAKQRR